MSTQGTPPAPLVPSNGTTSSAGDHVIVAQNLRRVFGDEVALDDLQLAIPRGSIYGFVGPSGSGKTTAVRLLTGIDRPTAGTAAVLGRETAAFDRETRRRIGYLPQDSVQFPNLSVRENLSFAASLYGLPLRRSDMLEDILRRTELYEHRKKPVRALSGGMRRRLALSVALVHDPEVLFLDEPTAGLDPVLRRKLWDWFEGLRDEGHTLFVTTQYVSEAAYCDRVGVLAHGRLVAEDSPDGLRRRALGGDVIDLTPTLPFDNTTMGMLRDLDGVREARFVGGSAVRLVVDAAERRLPQIQDWCTQQDLKIESIREQQVPFDDVFASLMQSSTEDGVDEREVA